MKTPTLETDRLILRPFKQDDAADVFECWESDPDVAKYMFWTSHKDIEKTKEWIIFELGQIEKQDWYRFAIVLKDTNTLVGTALIYYEDEVECWEIGYNLGKKYWGKGYTTEAMKRVIDFAVSELKLTQIVGRYAKENPASGNVMNKLGFKYEKDIPYECNNGAIMREGIQCRLVIDSGDVKCMSPVDKAKTLFEQKFHCSQSVFAAFATEFGLTEKQALKIGACFGAGMCKGEVCGACTGALMALGLKYGQSDIEDLESRCKTNDITAEFLELFCEENGSYFCKELLGCDLGTPEGIEYAKSHNLFTEFCPKMVVSATKIVEKLMNR